MRGRARIGLIVLALVGAGCGATPPTTPSEPPPSAVDPGTSADPVFEEAVIYAIAQRKQFGLRSDEAWVRQVAADPRARIELLDFPMLPEEEAEFTARQASLEEVALVVGEYGAEHANEFGGVWIDQDGHTVVAAWTANTELHRIGILAKLGAIGPLEVRLVRYSERDLNALTDRLFADTSWYATVDAAPYGGGAMIMDNRVELNISSANPDAPALIRAHFAAPPDMLAITSDGTGILLRPRGTIQGMVVAAAGERLPEGLNLAWVPDRPGGGDCGNMTGVGPGPDGRFELPCAPGGWTIKVQASVADGWVDVGVGHVDVPSGETVELTITVRPATVP